MAVNYFIGRTREELESALREAQDDLLKGSALIRADILDSSTQSRVEKSNEERVRMILTALNKIAPDDYPIGQTSAIERTRVVFGCRQPQNDFDPLF